jgi:hypothetical protein
VAAEWMRITPSSVVKQEEVTKSTPMACKEAV